MSWASLILRTETEPLNKAKLVLEFHAWYAVVRRHPFCERPAKDGMAEKKVFGLRNKERCARRRSTCDQTKPEWAVKRLSWRAVVFDLAESLKFDFGLRRKAMWPPGIRRHPFGSVRVFSVRGFGQTCFACRRWVVFSRARGPRFFSVHH